MCEITIQPTDGIRFKHRQIAAPSVPSSVPGIVLTPFYLSGEFSETMFVLTHEGTGWKIAGPFHSDETARKIAGALGGLGTWDATVDGTVQRNKILRAVRCPGDRRLEDWFNVIIKGF